MFLLAAQMLFCPNVRKVKPSSSEKLRYTWGHGEETGSIPLQDFVVSVHRLKRTILYVLSNNNDEKKATD